MKITTTTANLLAVLFVAIMILLVSLNVQADEYGVYDEKNHHADIPIKGDKGDKGKDGESIVGATGAAGRDGRDAQIIFSRRNIIEGITMSASLGMLTEPNHATKSHKHRNFSVSAVTYRDVTSAAIGGSQQFDNGSTIKYGISFTSGDYMAGTAYGYNY